MALLDGPTAPPDAQTAAPTAPQGGSPNAPVYAQIIQGIEAKIPPELKQGYHQIVVAGMKLLFSNETHHLLVTRLQAAQQGGKVPGEIVKGTVDVIKMLFHESQGKMNVGAAFPAGATLMYHLFEYAEHAQPGTQYSSDIIAGAAQELVKQLLQTFHVTPEQLQQGVEANQQKAGGAPPPAEAPTAPADATVPPQGGM